MSSSRALCCLPSVKKQNMTSRFASLTEQDIEFSPSSRIAGSGVDPSRLRVFFYKFIADKFSSFEQIASSTLIEFLN